MTTPEQPPEWAMQRAIDELNVEVNRTGSEIKWRLPRDKGDSPVVVLARLIAKHEQPPVDPILAAAREAVARWYDGDNMPLMADNVRSGAVTLTAVDCAVAAITLYLEREASK